jgi:hypothetical protein
MMTLLRWFFRRLDRRPSPIGELKGVHLVGLHINHATARSIVGDPRLAIRISRGGK